MNVQSNSGSQVAFWMVDPLIGHPVLASLPGRSQGFTHVAANASQALDYVKAPLFDFALGRALPPTGTASADDLQDLLVLFLEQCKTAGGEILAAARSRAWFARMRRISTAATPTNCARFVQSTRR